jgi:ABC-type antimicrobial peptide transport system permease subunit
LAAGTAIGLVLAALSGRLIQTMLFGISPFDPTTFAMVTLVLAITAALAIIGPGWHATRIDPVDALRRT